MNLDYINSELAKSDEYTETGVGYDYYRETWAAARSILKSSGIDDEVVRVLDQLYITAQGRGNYIEEMRAAYLQMGTIVDPWTCTCIPDAVNGRRVCTCPPSSR